MIWEASIYALKKLPAEEQSAYGTRVLTMSGFPRGIRRTDIDLWIPSAGPSLELLVALRAGQTTWEQFLARYTEEQEQQHQCHVVSYRDGMPLSQDYPYRSLDYLVRLLQERDGIAILCWEQHERCHRFKLAELTSSLVAQELRVSEGGMP